MFPDLRRAMVAVPDCFAQVDSDDDCVKPRRVSIHKVGCLCTQFEFSYWPEVVGHRMHLHRRIASGSDNLGILHRCLNVNIVQANDSPLSPDTGDDIPYWNVLQPARADCEHSPRICMESGARFENGWEGVHAIG